MDRRTGADRDNSTKLPTGQTSRGYSDTTSRNPKSNSSRRPDVVGRAPNEGGAALQNNSGSQTSRSDGYPETVARSNFNDGNPASVPGPENINRGYTQVTGANVPRVSRVTSSNRQNFSIDPGDPPQPQGDDSNGPRIPKYGVGTTGE